MISWKVVSLFTVLLVKEQLATEAARIEKVAKCENPAIPNAEVRCTTKSLVHTTFCRIVCNRNYFNDNGPRSLTCHRGLWYVVDDAKTFRFTSQSPCKKVFSGDGRSFDGKPIEKHDGMCSSNYCSKRYYGISEGKCESFSCCWDSKKSDCYGYLDAKCQIALAKRSPCPGTWFGIPQQKCEMMGCCYYPATSMCYIAKKEPNDLKTLQKEIFIPGKAASCGNIEGSLPNGRLNCEELNGIMTCTAECQSRFVLEGVSTRSCNIESNEWTPGTWKCRLESCRKIPRLPNTFIDCTNGDKIGSTCSASCARGFTLLSTMNSATCNPLGEWSSPALWQCTELLCPILDVQSLVMEGAVSYDGTMATIACTKGRKFGSVCLVSCPLGYMRDNANSLRCGLDGDWTKATFWCIPLRCAPPSISNNIRRSCTNGNKVGSKCNLSCSEGYELVGESTVLCRANQRWSGLSLPSCQIVQQCSKPEVSENVELECNHGWNVGTLCSLKCPAGEKMRGYNINVMTCLQSMTWDVTFEGESCAGPPKCGTLEEGFPSAKWENLKVTCAGDNQLGSVCSIECNNGVEESVATSCVYNEEEEVVWDEAPPRCINLATQACDLEIDLSDGTVKGIDGYENYAQVMVAPSLPFWSLYNMGGSNQCEYQSAVKIDYLKLSSFALKLKYELPSSYHFELSNSQFVAGNMHTLRAKGFNIEGTPGVTSRRLFPSKNDIMFTLTKGKSEVVYKVGSADDDALPQDFPTSKTIYVGLNRAVDTVNDFNMARMGSGLCKFCLSYATLL